MVRAMNVGPSKSALLTFSTQKFNRALRREKLYRWNRRKMWPTPCQSLRIKARRRGNSAGASQQPAPAVDNAVALLAEAPTAAVARPQRATLHGVSSHGARRT